MVGREVMSTGFFEEEAEEVVSFSKVRSISWVSAKVTDGVDWGDSGSVKVSAVITDTVEDETCVGVTVSSPQPLRQRTIQRTGSKRFI